jgi:hypothetical protein
LTVAVLVLAAAVLAGCVGPSGPTSASPTPSRTLSPAPSPEPATAQPVLAFGGDCANVITDAQLTGVLGPSAGLRPEGGLDLFWLPSAETGGGLRCAWNANATGEERIPGADHVWADVLASDRVPAETKEHYAIARCEGVYDGTVCYLGIESGGSWALLSTGLLEYNGEVAPQALSELASFVSVNAREHPSPVASQRTRNWWTRPNCEALGLAIGLDGFLSHPQAGYWEGGPGAFDAVLSEAGLQIECPWVSEYLDEGDSWGTLIVTVAPGSGWMWQAMRRIEQHGAAGGPPIVSNEVEVMGASEARQVSYGEEQGMVVATDGTNIVRVAAYVGDPIAATERVLGVLAESR